MVRNEGVSQLVFENFLVFKSLFLFSYLAKYRIGPASSKRKLNPDYKVGTDSPKPENSGSNSPIPTEVFAEKERLIKPHFLLQLIY
jgi:hypothetical protein